MKLTLRAMLVCACAPAAQAADIAISGAIDGPLSGGTPKAIEVYVINDIADLSQCGLGSANNGGGSDGQEFTFDPGPVSAGTYLYVASEAVGFADFFGFSPDYTAGMASINGDDAIELFCAGEVVDTFGEIDVDGNGRPWEYLDGWAYRVSDTGPDGSEFVQSNWFFSGPNALDGVSNNSAAGMPFPLANFATDGSGSDGGGDDGGSDDGGDSGSGGSGGDSDTITNACFNCPDLSKIASAEAFDDSAYYASVLEAFSNSLSVSEIRGRLSDRLRDGHNVLSYSEVWTALTQTDEDPANSDNVLLLYKGNSISKFSNASGSQSTNTDNWNREHVWAKSHGFSSSSLEAYSDIHHLRPSDVSVNSDRGNLDFDLSDNALPEAPENRKDNDSFEPRDAVKGDVARMVLYMDVRYEGLDSTPDLVAVDHLTNTGDPQLGRLCRLVEWHIADPVDTFEQTRNDRIYEFQGNRNPFIDHPEWVSQLYSTAACSGSGENPGDGGSDDGGSDDGGVGDGGSDGGSTGGDVPAFAPMILTGLFDGPISGNPKVIEVYLNESIDDLSRCGVGSANNGGGSDGQELTFDAVSGSAGDFIYIATETPQFESYFGFAPDYTSNSASINGDDAIELFCDGEVIDVFGDINVDGSGEPWEYRDGWAYRNAQTGPDGSEFVIGNWTLSGKDVNDGQSSNADAPTPFPLGTFYAAVPELYISEYIEGSSNNKAIEIYNPGSSTVDLSAGNYVLTRYANGSTSGGDITLTGSIAGKDVYVVAHPSAAAEILAEADQTSGTISHNGDDAYVLSKAGEVIDSFGEVGEDPGSAWSANGVSTKDQTLIRLASVTQGDTVIDDAFDPSIEWAAQGKNNFDFIGFHGTPSDEEPALTLGACYDDATLISAVQGDSDVSPLVGEDVVIEGIVSAVYPQFDGFYVQEESADQDADPMTSEGIFVFAEGMESMPASGDVVRILGGISEFYEKTEMTTSELISCGTDAVVATTVTLPFTSAQQREALEGMLVTFSDPLVVTDSYSLQRFGDLTLSSELLFIPTNIYPAGSEEAVALAEQNALNQVVLDDLQPGTYPENIIYPTGNLSASNTVRLGDSVSSLTGVFDYSYSAFRILPTQAPVFTASNPRPAQPELTEGNLLVASLNVLNLFNGDGQGAGFPTSRGADSLEEYERQIDKTVTALLTMDADIVGLMEIENDGVSANSTLAELVGRLNAQAGEGTYAFVNAGGPVGTDQITTALLYKPASVTPVGDVMVNMDSIFNRPPLLQQFASVQTGGTLAVVVNHFKSKGCGGASGDDSNQGDGQSCFNARRVEQATTLSDWIASAVVEDDVLIIGDLNAYAKEDPILALEQAGFTNLVNRFNGAEAYSYAYGGEVGYLDHALASANLDGKVVDAIEWHINAAEPELLDYNLENKTEIQASEFYAVDAYRVSDHDPVLISIVTKAPGDWDGNGIVDRLDLNAMMMAFRLGEQISLDYDATGDGVIDVFDLVHFNRLCTYRSCMSSEVRETRTKRGYALGSARQSRSRR